MGTYRSERTLIGIAMDATRVGQVMEEICRMKQRHEQAVLEVTGMKEDIALLKLKTETEIVNR